MEMIEIAAGELARTIRERASGGWYVLKINGCAFKIYRLWAQVMTAPDGTRASGSMFHKSQRALVGEIQEFIGGAQ